MDALAGVEIAWRFSGWAGWAQRRVGERSTSPAFNDDETFGPRKRSTYLPSHRLLPGQQGQCAEDPVTKRAAKLSVISGE